MINATSCKDGEEVSVTLAETKEELICEVEGVMAAMAESTFKEETGRMFNQATKQERMGAIIAAYFGMFIRFAADNDLDELAKKLLLWGFSAWHDIHKAGDEK
jgi:hypothetical protein